MARRWKKFVGATVFLILALLIVGITFTVGWRPFIGPKTRPLTNRTFEATPARLERGTYLVNAVYGCFVCHSERDRSLPEWPPRADKLGAGTIFGSDGAELPGQLVAPNLTPDKETGTGDWSDDALAREVPAGLYIGHVKVEGGPATILHQEHAPIALSEGTYRVRRQRELEPKDAAIVAD